MLSRPLSLASLVSPALLWTLVAAPGCTGRPDPVTLGRSLEASFPGRSAVVLRAGSGFAATAAGFSTRRGRLRAELPANAAGAIHMHAPGGADVSVREIDAAGDAHPMDRAVAYARPGGASFWTALPDGVEEWLRFEPGVVMDGAPAATWEVSGGSLAQRGEAVEVLGDGGRLWVTAPAAFAEGGQRVAARVRARGATIELFVDAGGRGVLVDPKWAAVASMPTPFEYHVAVALADGRALVLGGDSGGGAYAIPDVVSYDPAGNAWNEEQPMTSARTYHAATTLTSGKVIASGGQSNSNSFNNDAEIFDPIAKTWTSVVMPSYHSAHTSTLLGGGTVLLAGGWGPGSCGGQITTNNVDLYDPTLGMNGGWGTSTQMNESRQYHAASVLPSGSVLVSGGDSGGGSLYDAEIYDPGAQTWTLTEGTMNDARELHTSVLLPDGTVLVAGGLVEGEGFATLSSAEIFNPADGSWTYTGSMSTPRYAHDMVAIPGGQVIAVGGDDGDDDTLATTEIYDPIAHTWSPGPTMITTREGFSLTPLGNSLLAAGGYDGNGATATAEILVFGLPNGSPCSMDSACASTHCTGDLCCDTTCTGTCMACTAKLKGASGGADGTCGPIASGTASTQCTPESPATCGTTGFCDGKGACATYSDGTVCENPTPCIVAVCAEGKCQGPNKLDGSPCPGGVCVAGGCVPDPTLGTTSSSGGGATASSTSSSGGSGGAVTTTTTKPTGTGGQGGEGGTASAELTGSGCAVGPQPRSSSGAAAMALGLLAMLGLRRRRR